MKTTYQISALLSILLFWNCNASDSPSISVGSHTFNEQTIKSENPDFYAQLKEQFNQQMYHSLKRAATEKLIEMAAQENDQTAKEYMQTRMQSVKPPTDDEIKESYDELKGLGSIANQSYAQLKDQLGNVLLEEKREEVIAVEIGKLRKKYGYKDSFEIRKDISAKDARIRGDKDASITIIEFSDFECPYCARTQKTTRKLRKMYGSKIQFAFYDFPLNFHKNAMYAHIAGQCIAKQSINSYWKYFDILFARQQFDRTAIKKSNVDQLAQSLNLNNMKYNTCVLDPTTKSTVEKEMALGSSVGVRGTPAFFINGRFINGAAPLSDFVAIIEEELD